MEPAREIGRRVATNEGLLAEDRCSRGLAAVRNHFQQSLGLMVEPQARMIEDRNDPLETTLWNGVDHGT
jgi:hypothetical protein